MKLQLVSDLHIRHYKNMPPFIDKGADILLIAGDIDCDNLEDYLNELSLRFKYVIFILGNHCYYGKEVSYIPNTELLNSNVIFLHNSCFELEDVVFIGTPLWSDLNNNDWVVCKNVSYNINDFKLITGFNTAILYNIYLEQKRILIENLEKYKDSNKKIVVMTHFLPSFSLVSDYWKQKGGLANHYYVGNCDNIINEYNDKISLWLFGHTHLKNDSYLGNIRFVCNPLGYPREEQDLEIKVVEI